MTADMTADDARRVVDIHLRRHTFPGMFVEGADPDTVGEDTTGWVVTFADGDDRYTVQVTGFLAQDVSVPQPKGATP